MATAEELNLGNLGSLIRLAGTVSRALEDGKLTVNEAIEIANAIASSGLIKIRPELMSKVQVFIPVATEVIKALEDGKFTTVEICDAGIAVLTAVKSLAGEADAPIPTPTPPAPESGGESSGGSGGGFTL